MIKNPFSVITGFIEASTLDRYPNLPRISGGPRRKWIVRLVANGLAQSCTGFAVAWLIDSVLSEIAGSNILGGFPVLLVGALALAAAASLGLSVQSRRDAERLGQDYVMKVRLQLFRRIAYAPSRAEASGRLGISMARMTTDLTGLKNWVSLGVAQTVIAVLSITGYMAVLTYFTPASAAAAAGFIVLSVGATGVMTGLVRTRIREMRRRRGQLTSKVGESLQAIETVIRFGGGNRELRRLRSKSKKLSGATIDTVGAAAVMQSLPDAALPIFFGILIGLVVNGQVSGRELVTTLVLFGMIANSLRNLAHAWYFGLMFEEAQRRINQILSMPIVKVAKNAQELDGEDPVKIALDDIHVKDALYGVTAIAEAGSRIMVVGPTGSGKSTLLELVIRMFDPDRGLISMNGVDLRLLSEETVCQSFQLVSPRLPLLRGTVYSNITYGFNDGDSRIDDIVGLCGLDEIDNLLPEGLDTRVEEQGKNLPAGLWARIALARALMARPRVLLIDHPAFFLHDNTANAVLKRVLKLQDATILVAGIEKHVIEPIDRIWCLDDGRLIDVRNAGDC